MKPVQLPFLAFAALGAAQLASLPDCAVSEEGYIVFTDD